MDKNAVFGYVEYAREELQKLVRQKAFEYGITEKGAEAALNGVIKGRVLSKAEVTERDDLISNIHANEDGKGFANGFDIVMEEAAYTWFNRFIALRFMEVNGYLPSHTRVFSDETGKFNPQIIKEALTVDIYNIDRIKVADMVQNNRNDELFKYLIILQCNELSKPMPKMFERIANYTELLFPNGLLKKGSIIDRLVSDIAEEDWKEQVQIIGWMYQFYVASKRESYRKEKVVTKKHIPTLSQVFTPDWIVRYMAENSIGRIWLESYPNSSIKSEMKYYVEDAEQEADVKTKLEEIRYKDVNPEDIKVIEPCCGSGHIMVYCFDLLYKMYIEKGYAPKDIATSILKNNIWGLDIDKRASQLAYFSVMMKARSVDRQFLTRDIVQQPRVYEIVDSQPILQFDYEELLTKYEFTSKSISTAKYLVSTFKYAKVIGSLLIVNRYDYRDLIDEINQKSKEIVPDLIRQEAWQIVLPQLKRLAQLAMVMSRKYDVMITNPPYIGGSKFEKCAKDYYSKHYALSKNDLSTMFMEADFLKKGGFLGLVNPDSWMFVNSYAQFRKKYLDKIMLVNMVHVGFGVFDAAVQTTSFVFRYFSIKNKTVFIRLIDDGNKRESLSWKTPYVKSYASFKKMPGNELAYWLNDNILDAFTNTKCNEIVESRIGLVPGNNEKYVRYWYEVNLNNIGRYFSRSEAAASRLRWFFYDKGGAYRKWYGNQLEVVDWYHDGHELQTTLYPDGSRIWAHNFNLDYIFKEHISCNDICGHKLSFRFFPRGFLFDSASNAVFTKNDISIYYLLGFFNSKPVEYLSNAINPTIHLKPGDIDSIPFIIHEQDEIEKLVKENISICKRDWDCLELSIDYSFQYFTKQKRINDSFVNFLESQKSSYDTLKQNEELINTIISDGFNLGREIPSTVNESDISINVPDKVVFSKVCLSLAIGVSFGRYSLDHEGLCYAGGDWDSSLYSTIIPDTNNIIPILDDGYYVDDAMNKVVEFVTKVYGQDTLDENLKFIADALGGNGTSKEVIRNYLLSGFYSDHLKTYQKRPIYWLFDAGKQNSFKALIYMHRYTPDLLAKMRTDYILPLMDKYSSRIEFLEREIPTLTGVQATKSRKELEKVKAQLKEISEYEPKIHHLADERISIDLDDGVKHNYELFKDVLAPIK